MPVPKRYFHCSQDINDDEEVWELTESFGDRALRVWLEVLAILDKTDNQLSIKSNGLGWVTKIGRKTKTYPTRVLLILGWCVEREWLQCVFVDNRQVATRDFHINFTKITRRLAKNCPKTARRLRCQPMESMH